MSYVTSLILNSVTSKIKNSVKAGKTFYLLVIRMGDDFTLQFEKNSFVILGKQVGNRKDFSEFKFLSKSASGQAYYESPKEPNINFLFQNRKDMLKVIEHFKLGFYSDWTEEKFGFSNIALSVLDDLAAIESMSE